MSSGYLAWREHFVSLAPDKYPAEWIDAQVASGAFRCWANMNAAILAEIRTYPSGLKEVHGLAAAGCPASILRLIPSAEAWGRANGCTLASLESRRGWARMLPEYQENQVRLVKDLRDGL